MENKSIGRKIPCRSRNRSGCLVSALAALAITGCSTATQPSSRRSPLDVSLTEPCPPLGPLADGTGAVVLRWILATTDAYNDCAARHRRLTEAVR